MSARRPPPAFLLAACWMACLVLAGCSRKEPMYKPAGEPKVKLTIRLGKPQPFPGAEEVALPKGKECFDPRTDKVVSTLFVSKDTVLTNEDIAGTSVGRQTHNPDHWFIEVTLNPAGRDKLAQATTGHVGDHIVISFDGRFEMAPVVREAITGGATTISGEFTEAQATDLAQGLVGQ